MPNRMCHFPLLLLTAYGALFIAVAHEPFSRADWALESVMPIAFVTALIVTSRWFRFSAPSYLLIFIYLCMHTLGSHFTYSLVPYRELIASVNGHGALTAGDHRNHYDRLVHLCYGLLLAYPLCELLTRTIGVRGVWRYLLPVEVAMSTSMLYELIEWGAAALFGGELGAAYVGTQGDEWDAQKDMALATIGAAIAVMLIAAIERIRRSRLGAGCHSTASATYPRHTASVSH